MRESLATAGDAVAARVRSAPVIDWRGKHVAAKDRTTDWAAKPWMSDLTTRLGQSDQEANPNARIRIAVARDPAIATTVNTRSGARL